MWFEGDRLISGVSFHGPCAHLGPTLIHASEHPRLAHPHLWHIGSEQGARPCFSTEHPLKQPLVLFVSFHFVFE